MSDFEFLGKILIESDLECLTALHIGGTQEGYEIGGMDNPVIKCTTTIESDGTTVPAGAPYIPGSSLRGKMRSLLEWAMGKVVIKGENNGFKGELCKCGEADCPVCIPFGVSAQETTKSGPTRLAVLDAFPTKETIKSWEEDLGEGIYTEVKSENYIDRLTSQANPRSMERVPAGSVFRTKMIYTMYREKDLEFLKNVFLAMEILEDSTLGGGGSRGSGRVRFKNFDIWFRSRDYYLENAGEIPIKNLPGSISELKRGFDSIFTPISEKVKRAAEQ
jgi:CRISPR-associated protein Csm3